jgi:3-methyladenine DNA glycosylase/8-oxoguanine DNA glycosylase
MTKNNYLYIPAPHNFNFRRTVLSHGWSELLPFALNQGEWTLTRVLELNDSRPITVRITAAKRGLKVGLPRPLGRTAETRVVRDVRHMFRLDDDLGGFYRTMEAVPDFAWVAGQGAGRMLRSPTLFEDVVKMICTTNCSWALTDKMVNGLVQHLGREAGDGRRTFPSPEAMALMPLNFFVNEVRAGYRAAYLKELAERVAAGELDIDGWLRSDKPTAELLKNLKTIKGVGDYAAENLLRLIGRYDGLALDSWTRAKFYRVRNGGRRASDNKIARYYARFKEWRGLALWCDLTQDWLEAEDAEH